MKNIATLIVLTFAFFACTKNSNGDSKNNQNGNASWTITSTPSNYYDGVYIDDGTEIGWENTLNSTCFQLRYGFTQNSNTQSFISFSFLHRPTVNKSYRIVDISKTKYTSLSQNPIDDSSVFVQLGNAVLNTSISNQTYGTWSNCQSLNGGYIQVNESNNGKTVSMIFNNISMYGYSLKSNNIDTSATWKSKLSGTVVGYNY